LARQAPLALPRVERGVQVALGGQGSGAARRVADSPRPRKPDRVPTLFAVAPRWRRGDDLPRRRAHVRRRTVEEIQGGRGAARARSRRADTPGHDTRRRARLAARPTSAALRSRRDNLPPRTTTRSEEHTSELQSLAYLVCRL